MRPRRRPSPSQSQQRLVQRLYAKHSEELLAFFRAARTIAKADAADLLQQTFSELLETLARRRDLHIEHPRAFLFKIAVRQLCAWERGRNRRPHVDDEAPLASLRSADVRDDLELQASLRSEQRLVLRAMRTLNGDVGPVDSDVDVTDAGNISRLQLLVYFRFWVGLTLDEVAALLDVTPGVISGRQRHALQCLQRQVRRLGHRQGSREETSTTTLTRWRAMLEHEAASSHDRWRRLEPHAR